MTERTLSHGITRRKLLIMGSGLVGAFALSACGQSAPSSNPTSAPQSQPTSAPAAAPKATPAPTAAPQAAKAAKFVMKTGTVVSAEHPNTKAMEEFGKRVKERTNGEVEVQVFPSSQLGGEKEMFEGMRLGSVQGGPINVSVGGAWVPEGQIFDLPFVFRDPDHAYKVYMGDFGKQLAQLYPSQGVVVVGYWVNGVRQPMAKKPLITPADVKGLKMRVIQSEIHVDTWKALGANPTPMAASEMVAALQQGTVDFLDNSLATYWDMKLFELVPHVTLLSHIYSIGAFSISKKFWDTLPADHQNVIRKAAEEVIPLQNQWLFAADDKAKADSQAKGAVFHTVDQAPWREAVKSVWEKWAPKFGGMAKIEQIVNTK